MSSNLIEADSGVEGRPPAGVAENDGNRKARAADLIQQTLTKSLAPEAQAIAEGILAELDPQGVVEMVLARQVILATLRLGRVAGEEAMTEIGDAAWSRAQTQAEGTLYKALAELRKLRSIKKEPREPIAAVPGPTPPVLEPQPIEPVPPKPDSSAPAGTTSGPVPWRERVTIDPAISKRWPVLRGTTITVDHIMALYEEGKTSSEILTYYPELSEDDLLICQACEEAGGSGPIDP